MPVRRAAGRALPHARRRRAAARRKCRRKIRNEKAAADGFRVDADFPDDGGDVSGEDRLSNDADADALDFGQSSVTERVTGVTGDSQFGGNAGGWETRLLTRRPRTKKKGEEPRREPPSLLASFVPPRAVASFLWAVIRRVAPRETLGGRRSRASLRRFLLRLTSLRRSEKCTLHGAMRGARTEEFPWLFGRRGAFAEDEWKSKKKCAGRSGPVTAYLARRRRLRRWFRFLIAEVAVPLLRAHFYCTETEANRNRLFFYRKGVWARLTAAHLAATTEDEAGETKAPAPMRLSGGVPVDPAAAATTARKPYARLKKPRRGTRCRGTCSASRACGCSPRARGCDRSRCSVDPRWRRSRRRAGASARGAGRPSIAPPGGSRLRSGP